MSGFDKASKGGDPWKSVADEETGGSYWWNTLTNETTEGK